MGQSWNQLQAILGIANTIGAARDVSALLGTVIGPISALMQADRSTLYVVDPAAGQLWSKVAVPDGTLEIRLKIGQGLSGWCALMGVPVRIDDVLQDDRFDARWDKRSGYRTQTMLCVPMKAPGGRVVGVLQCLNKRRGRFDDHDQAMLTAIAAMCALAVDNDALRTAAAPP